MSDLQALIKSTLGVVPSAPTPPSYSAAAYAPTNKNGWAPERPSEMYEYRIDVCRNEYGVVYVTATSPQDARDNIDWGDIDWCDNGDADISDTEEDPNGEGPVNQSDIDDWDVVYGKKHDCDGQPKCSDCETMFDNADYLTSNEDGDKWFCADCLSDHE